MLFLHIKSRKYIMMKCKLLLVLVVMIIASSCSISNKEKAENLIGEYILGTLTYPDSYEPISTRVDSMFIDTCRIESIIEISEDIKDLLGNINGCKHKIEMAELSIDNFAPDDYLDESSLPPYYMEVLNEKDEAESDLENCSIRLNEELLSLKDEVKEYHKGEFTGWIVRHRYNALNEYGLTPIMPCEEIFFCNEDFTSCSCIDPIKYIDLQIILKIVYQSETNDDIIEKFKDEFVILPF